MVAALASWLDARAHDGTWLVRIEDVDTPRCIPGADTTILQQLARCGLLPDEAPVWQSQRGALYQQALDQLVRHGLAYPCGCTRKDIEDSWATRGVAPARHTAMPYPGTCRDGLHGRAARAWRLKVGSGSDIFKKNKPPAPAAPAQAAINTEANNMLHWHDRRLGAQQQDVAREVGDFILQRADGLWAYQLAVVVDDAAQGITHIVRGEDLADNTPRQIMLQQALGVPSPQYLHTPLVRGPDGDKLSKQNGAQALDLAEPLVALNAAAGVLGLAARHGSCSDALAAWVREWQGSNNG